MTERTQILFLSDVIVVVASLDLKVPILFDSGVPVVLWHLLAMVSWLSIPKSSVAFCVLRPLVFIGVVKLLFVLSPLTLTKVHDRTNNYKAKNATVGIVKRP